MPLAHSASGTHHATPHPSRTAVASAAALLALLASALPLSAHATNGYFAHGYGAQSLGAAGVAAALPQDALVIATNPAAISALGSRLDAGLTYFAPRREASIQGSPVPGLNGQYDGNGKKNFWIPEFGYTRQLSPSLSAGLAVYGNGGMNTRYERNPYAAIGGQGRAGVNLEQLFISPAVSYKLNAQHSLGAALNLVHQRFSAEGLQGFDQGGFSSSPGSVTNRGTDTSNGVGLRLGWLGELTPDLKLGVGWASSVRGRFDKYKGLFADQGNFDIPASYTLGLSYQLTPRWQLGADYQVIQYSDVKPVSNPLGAFLAGKKLGDDAGPGFGWKDIDVVKLAVIHRPSDALTLRAGYSHAKQPIPRDQTFFNVLAPGVVQDHVTLGFTWKTGTQGEWTGYAAHAFGKTVSGQNSIPANLLGGGEANIRMKQNILGVAYGWRF